MRRALAVGDGIKMAFKNITAQQKAAFLSALRSGQYNLLLGAGASMDSTNDFGLFPSGNAFRDELCKLKSISNSHTLQRVYSLLTDKEIDEYVTKRFQCGTPGRTAELISSFIWRRIFTWNVDNILEKVYSINNSRQQCISIHYSDDFQEAQNLCELPIVHLHGCVLSASKGYVFSRNEYISQIRNISHWMTVLAQFLQSEPFIISGTSLDEFDLDFYLAHRTNISSRDDRGPSIIVEAVDDEVTHSMCAKHNLLHFVGHSRDFFEYCATILPHRPTPLELVPHEMQSLLHASLSKSVALAFSADFELVPSDTPSAQYISRFMYGHVPSWMDIATGKDISRPIVTELLDSAEKVLGRTDSVNRIILLSEIPGSGKTTVLRRTAFELARRGYRTLICSAISRLSSYTASAIDLIDGPVVLVVDNFADRVTAVADMINRLEKQDVVIVAAERNYRFDYIRQVLSGINCRIIHDTKLQRVEIERLIDKYIEYGIVSNPSVIRHRAKFVTSVSHEPIAIACCRITNDFNPLDRIVRDVIAASSDIDKNRYIMTALAYHCFRGGLRYEILIGALGPPGLRLQIGGNHPLPLAYCDLERNFVAPENATLAQLVLEKASEEDEDRLLDIFVSLSKHISSLVNRRSIMQRSPESRLVGRLFNYDDVVANLLKNNSEKFYSQAQKAWQWNSRYWEQVALLNLAKYFRLTIIEDRKNYLEMSCRYARHAVSIERHPHTLTTLGKVLMTQMDVEGYSITYSYNEAFNCLCDAIDLEASWSRIAVQPYVSLLRGTIKFLECNGQLSISQRDKMSTLTNRAADRFSRDNEVQNVISCFRAKGFGI